MTETNLNNKIKDATITLLECKNDFYYMKQSVDTLYGIFKDITHIDINRQNDGEILLPSGKAISPSAAAHCLLEMKRTAIFIRGIKKAIETALKDNPEGINILYAGCGPYATLITPLLALYAENELKTTLLDINQQSLVAVEMLINKLNLNGFINGYIMADASEFRFDKDYAIVISETMQMCLQNEPQVAIMKNLIPQMDKDAIFIPEQVSIDAFMRNPGKWDGRQARSIGEESKFLSNLFSVNKTNLDHRKYRKTLTIPNNLNNFIELMLHTTITVYKDEVLNLNDCSLNLPKKYYEFKDRYANKIEFWYELTEMPKIESKVIEFA